MERSVPTRSGVKEISVGEGDVKALEGRGWRLKPGPAREPKKRKKRDADGRRDRAEG